MLQKKVSNSKAVDLQNGCFDSIQVFPASDGSIMISTL